MTKCVSKKSFFAFGFLFPLVLIIAALSYFAFHKQSTVSNPPNTSTTPEVSQQLYPEDRFSSTTTFKLFADPDADFTMEYPIIWNLKKRSGDVMYTSSTKSWVFSYKNIEIAGMVQFMPSDQLDGPRVVRIYPTNDPHTDVRVTYYHHCPLDNDPMEFGNSTCRIPTPELSAVRYVSIQWWPGHNISLRGIVSGLSDKAGLPNGESGAEHGILFGSGEQDQPYLSDLPGFFPAVEYIASSIKIKK